MLRVLSCALRVFVLFAVVSAVSLAYGHDRPALAATFTVTKITDTNDGSCSPSDCSLREAIIAANNAAGPDVIAVPAGTYTLTRAGRGEQSASTGDLDITNDVTITGAGLGITLIDGHGIDRVFEVLGAGTDVEISGVTIRGGATKYGDGDGGGIANAGRLTLNTVEVTGNTATQQDAGGISSGGTLRLELGTIVHGNSTTNTGGGVSTSGSLFISASTVSDNSADSGAGGVAAYGDADIQQATISGNDGGGFDGGGIWIESGTLTVVNSTISGNHSNFNGGGIRNGSGFSAATATIANSTITGNTAGTHGGGVSNVAGGHVSLEESILWGNEAGTPDDDCHGAVESLGHNLLSAASAGCHPTGAVSTNIVGQDPLLGPQADNSGPTQIHALLPGSPAIDAGSPDCPPPATDQRGVARPQGPACDIGAFEVAVTPPPTPTPTPPGQQVLWGDVHCDGAVDSVDSLGDLRHLAQLSPLPHPSDCPEIGGTVEVAGFSPHAWGDVDCDTAVNSIDALRILRFVAHLSLTPIAGCPDVGAEVTITA